MKKKIIKTLLSLSIIVLSLHSNINCYAEININNNINNDNIVKEVLNNVTYKDKTIVDKYNITFYNGNLENVKEGKKYARAFVEYENKRIVVRDDLSKMKKKYVLYHEIGHILDEKLNEESTIRKYSSTKEFKDVLDDNYNKYHNIYELLSIDPNCYTKDKLNGEYFADMYAYYKLSNTDEDRYLEKYCPEVVEYMKSMEL